MSRHIKELDGIRGIAILMVMVWHYISCQPKDVSPGDLTYPLHILFSATWSGVDLFFVLSGFLIGGIIFDHHTKKSFLKAFWIRRACRILPVLLMLLVSCWIVGSLVDRERFGWLFDDLMPWWTYLTFTQNIAMGWSSTFGGHFTSVTWSLAVEEQFYLVAPLAVIMLGRKTSQRLLLPLILLAFVLRLVFPGFHANINTVFRMDSLLAGVLIACLYRHAILWQALERNRLVILGSFFCLLVATRSLIFNGFGNFQYLWFTVLYAFLLVSSLLYQSTKVTWVLRSKVLSFFGAIAYGLYMYHQPISGLLHGWLREAPPSLKTTDAALITLLALVLSVGVAWVSFVTVESAILRIGKRFKYGDEKAAVARFEDSGIPASQPS